MSNVTIDNIAQEFGKAFRREFDDMPLIMDEKILEMLKSRAIDYGAPRLLAMWITYIQNRKERSYGISVAKFLDPEKLNRLASEFGLLQKRRREHAAASQTAIAQAKRPSPEQILEGNILALREVVQGVPKEILGEIWEKTLKLSWFYDEFGVPRRGPLTDLAAFPVKPPVNRSVLAAYDSVKQWKEKGFIEYDETMMNILNMKFMRHHIKVVKGRHSGAFWNVGGQRGIRIEIGAQSVKTEQIPGSRPSTPVATLEPPAADNQQEPEVDPDIGSIDLEDLENNDDDFY